MKEIIHLILELAECNAAIFVDQGKLKIDAPEGVSLEALLPRIRRHKEQLIEYLSSRGSEKATDIDKAPEQDSYPMSSSQKQLWVLNQFAGASHAYTVPAVYVFEGPLDQEALQYSFQKLIERHEILRTVFRKDGEGELRQYILPVGQVNFSIAREDLRGKSEKVLEAKLAMAQSAPFVLSEVPLLRVNLYQTGDHRFVFSSVMHHIISDGWSMEIFIREVLQNYRQYCSGLLTDMPPLRIQYKDYAQWQQDQLLQPSLHSHRQYWFEKFHGEVPILQLNGDRSRPATKTYQGGTVKSSFDTSLQQSLKRFGRAKEATLFMVMLAAVKALLYRYSGQEDIVVGTPVAGRNHPDLQDQIGFYVNTIALRTTFSGEAGFDQLLTLVKESAIGGYRHQAYPFDLLVADLGLSADRSRHPLFDVMVSLENLPGGEKVNAQLDGIEVFEYQQKTERNASKFDLSFTFTDTGGELLSSLDYNADIFNRETAERLLGNLETLIGNAIDNPAMPLGQLGLLTATEYLQLTEIFNRSKVPFEEDLTVVQMFERCVQNNPEAVALVFEERRLSYAQLNSVANRLGRYLRKRYDINPDDLIGISLDRSIEMVVCVLGVLKSGAAYVPIDPEYPEERKQFMASDSACKAVIDPEFYSLFVADEGQFSDVDLEPVHNPEDLAYVIYTSGSTGTPKGVLIEHRSLAARMQYLVRFYGLTSLDNLIFYRSYSFDAAVEEYLLPLLIGGKSCIAPRNFRQDIIKNLTEFISLHGITKINMPPILLDELVRSVEKGGRASLSSLRIVVSGGDRLSSEVVNRFLSSFDANLYNAYGPTENTDDSTNWKADRLPGETVVPIGKPVDNSQVYILDKNGRLCPIGVEGEICVGGVGLARGYLNRPKLTAEKFVDNPFLEDARIYKTGDLGRWQADGNILFVGRKDNQVKIRGHRIELGEIEYALTQFPAVDAVAVSALSTRPGQMELVAYLVGEHVTDTQQVRSFLSRSLPPYLIPAHFVQLDELPLTANGKLDRKALPSPSQGVMDTGTAFVAPRHESERQLAKIWSEVLGVALSDIGINNNFFALGGHSLRAVRLASQIHKVFEVEIGLADLFAHADLGEQAAFIEGAVSRAFEAIKPVPVQEDYPLSESQRRLWIMSQFEESNIAYNMPAVYAFEGEVDTEALVFSFESLLQRHEILRTVFRKNDSGEVRQLILTSEELGFSIRQVDIRTDVKKLDQLLVEDLSTPFKLEVGPMFRVGLYRIGENRWIFSYVMHHIISDGWSMEVLIRDTMRFYSRFQEGKNEPLPQLEIQFKDFAHWQKQQLEGQTLEEHRKYWHERFAGELSVLDWSADKVRPLKRTFQGESLAGWFPQSLTEGLKKLARSTDSTLFMVVLAAVKAYFYRKAAAQDIVIGTPMAGREHIDLEDQIGFYTNTLALRTEFSGEDSFRNLLKLVKDTTLGGHAHQVYPFDQLVQDLSLRRDNSRHPLFDMQVILQEDHGEESGRIDFPEGLHITGYEGDVPEFSVFDAVFTFIDRVGGMGLHIRYNSDIYSRREIELVKSQLGTLLEAVVMSPEIPLKDLEMVAEAEREELLEEGDGHKVVYDDGQTLPGLFEKSASLYGPSTAAVFGSMELSYATLELRVNGLAEYLYRECGVRKGQPVGLMADRGLESLIGLLGILRSGGVYVPIDPAYPADRKRYIFSDTGLDVLLTDSSQLMELEYYRGTVIALDIQLELIGESTNGPQVELGKDDLAYVIYTSGSTGRPKGVQIRHGSIVNTILSQVEIFEAKAGEGHLQFASLSFDASLSEIFVSLAGGACLYLVGETEKRDPSLLGEYLQTNGISLATLPPGYARQIPEEKLRNLERLVTAGEQADREVAQRFMQHGTYINAYGPTEASICATAYKVSAGDELPGPGIPIGRPLGNTRIYVLSEGGRLQPKGSIGEICIGGAGVGYGYLNLEEETNNSFVADPFVEGGLMYRTGDLGRWRTDGQLEFLGRKDSQLKLNGYRIEAGEIEHVLMGIEGVTAAVVSLRGQGMDATLVAYVQGEPALQAGRLRNHLSEFLPEYMVPGHFIALEAIPLTPSGKIDRRRLPEPEGSELLRRETYVAPRNAIEAKLVKIWSQVLDVEENRIGVLDNFFDLGGHSLKATYLAGQIQREFEVEVSLKDLFEHSTLEAQSALLGKLEKRSFQAIEPIEEKETYPLSYSQRRLWILSQFQESNIAYNMPGIYVFEGVVDRNALSLSFRYLLDRHEILRTVFRREDSGEVRQFVRSQEDLDFTIRFLDLQEQEPASLDHFLSEDVSTPFDLAEGPMLRARLYQISDDRYIFSYVMHHIISDGWSMEVLIRELMLLYKGLRDGDMPDLQPLRIQYRDFAHWQRQQLEGESLERHRNYWINQFKGELPVLDLSMDKPRPPVKTYRGATVNRSYSVALGDQLKNMARESGCSLFMVLLAAVKVLLHRHTGEEDIIIGTPMAGRDHADLEDQIGFYTNTLALRTQFTGDQSFAEILQLVKEVTLSGHEYQAYPFDHLVEDLSLSRDRSRHPLFDIQVILQEEEEVFPETKLYPEKIRIAGYRGDVTEYSVFDMVFTFKTKPTGLELYVRYNSDVYTRRELERLLLHLGGILEAVSSNGHLPVAELDYLFEQERCLLLDDFDQKDYALNGTTTLVELFEEAVTKYKDAAAVTCGGRTMSFEELSDWSDRIASYLVRECGLEPEQRVGLMLDRGIESLVGLLGIMKGGGVYVPVDPSYPSQRKQFIFAETGLQVLLTDSAQLLGLEFYDGEVFAMDIQLDTLVPLNEDLGVRVSPEQVAYLIYTSGSTGRPKGVQVEHKSIVNTVLAQVELFEGKFGENHLQFASLSFDASLSEIFVSLGSGACLHMVQNDLRKDPELLGEYLLEHQIDLATLPPAYAKQLPAVSLSSLSRLVTAGEAADLGLAQRFLQHGTYINAYGPTETSICATAYKVDKGGSLSSGRVPIGRPLANTRLYLLSSAGALQGIGCIGEICIGGPGLARGYLKRADENAERFVPDPFRPGERIYRTGDLGRRLANGHIEYIGRKDNQVKLHGYRIELGEVEQVLIGCETVDVAVATVQGEGADRTLVAYIKSDRGFDVEKLRSHASKHLPAYMVPGHYLQIGEIPLSINGKIDRRALPVPEELGTDTLTAYIAPRNRAESSLVVVYQEVLRKTGLGIGADFFKLGGDSIKSIQVVSRLKQEGYVLTIQDVLTYPIIEDLAFQVKSVGPEVSQETFTGRITLGPVQAHFFEQYPENNHHYNQSVLLAAREPVTGETLQRCLHKLVVHHDALRMIFYREEGKWVQENLGLEQLPGFEELTVFDTDALANECDRVQSGMNLATGPLFKAVLFHTPEGDRVLLVGHHLVVDGVSWRILLEDLNLLYQQALTQEELTLPPKTEAFGAWQGKLQQYAVSNELESERPYWSEVSKFGGMPLPPDMEDGSNLIADVSNLTFRLEESLTKSLLGDCHEPYRTHINDLLVTGLIGALTESFGLPRYAIQMEGHGREHIGVEIDVSRTIGWFTSTYPVVVETTERTYPDLLIAVKETLHRIPNKGIGYGVLKYLQGTELGLAETDIAFNYLGDFSQGTGNENQGQLFDFAAGYRGAGMAPDMVRNAKLEITGLVVGGSLEMTISYSNKQFWSATMEKLAGNYERQLRDLVSRLLEERQQFLTPVDLTFQGLSLEQVHKLSNKYGLTDIYRLSPLQEGLYYYWLGHPESHAYFMQSTYIMEGRPDLVFMEESFRRLSGRYDILRSVFTEDYGEQPLQVVSKNIAVDFRFVTAQDTNAESAEEYRERDLKEGFDLHTGPLMRLTILQLEPDRYEFIWSHHHILMDGWCSSLLIKEFFQVYYGLIRGREPLLDRVFPYSHYIKWLDSVDKSDSLQHWRSYLAGYDRKTSLPSKASHGRKDDYLPLKRSFHLTEMTADKLTQFCSSLGITESTFMQVVWGLLLARYNDVRDAVFGAVVSGRPAGLEGVEKMVGLFSNSIPVRIRYNPRESVGGLLKRIQEEAIAGTPYHFVQLAEVQMESPLGMDLFDTLLVYENFPTQEGLQPGNAEEHQLLSFHLSQITEQTDYDFTLTVIPGKRFKIQFDCNGMRFDDLQIDYLQSQFIQLIDQLLDRPEARIEDLDYLNPEQRFQLLSVFNSTEIPFDGDMTLTGQFEQSAREYWNTTAVVQGDRSLTFGQLSELSDRVSRYLLTDCGLQREQMVGLMTDRSIESIIGLLGILKAGGVYVPIDPSYPRERKRFMVSETGLQIMLTDSSQLLDLDFYEGEVLALDIQLDDLKSASPDTPATVAADQLAYIIYTSGSTGHPKGVLVEHRSIVNTILAQIGLFEAKAGERHLQFASLSFDASLSEIFVSLFSGACLHIIDENVRQNPQLLADYLGQQKIDLATLPPGYARQLPDQAALNLSRLVTAGEVADLVVARKFAGYGTYINAYGPTEASICATAFKASEGEEIPASVPIGAPIANCRIYLLNSEGNRLQGVGSIGEICIGGRSLARGYLNRPDEDAEKFMADPFCPGERIYRTGDLGRWRSDGLIEYVGRRDGQVKLRGFRIELSEIEQVLRGCAGVESVAVVMLGEGLETKLLAFVKTGDELGVEELRNHATNFLPAYMLPAQYLKVEEMPLTVSGKVDRKALANLNEGELLTGATQVPPRNETEERLAELWSTVLAIDQGQIGIYDNFFELGGHSLKATQLIVRIAREFEVELTMESIFRHPTIAAISMEIEKTNWVNAEMDEENEKSNTEKFFI